MTPPRPVSPEQTGSPNQAHRSHRRSVHRGRVLVAVVAIALASPWAFGASRSDSLENRALAPFPQVSADGLVDGSVFRQVDRALRDRLTLRTVVVRAVGNGSRDLAPTVSVNSKVVVGEDGTPFLAEDFTLPCKHPYDVQATDRALRALRALGQPTGKTMLVAIAPDKSSILTDRLGGRAGALMACSDKVRKPSEALWAGDPDAPVATFWQQLRAAEEAAPGRVMQPGDSHWTSTGALLFSRGVIDRLIAQGAAPSALAGAPTAESRRDRVVPGDLYRLMGATMSDSVPTWVVKRPGVTVKRTVVPSASGRGMRVITTSAPAGTPMVTGRTLVVYDSFFDRAEPFLSPYFTSLTALHWGDLYSGARNGTLPPFDHLIIESSQRGWNTRTPWLTLDDPVGRAIAAELGRPSVPAGAA